MVGVPWVLLGAGVVVVVVGVLVGDGTLALRWWGWWWCG